jgi:hypothetical protein
MNYGSQQPGGARKPLIRSEVGFGPPTRQFAADTRGVWLHNFIWAGTNPGGMIESYWYEDDHIFRKNFQGELVFDHRPVYRAYYNFIRRIPLTNGNYRDAAAQTSDERLRAWGQVDPLNRQGYLWISNRAHTWRKAAMGMAAPGIDGWVKVGGFRPGESYRVTWWDTYQPDPAKQALFAEQLAADRSGAIRLNLTGLQTDVAVQIYPLAPSSLFR